MHFKKKIKKKTILVLYKSYFLILILGFKVNSLIGTLGRYLRKSWPQLKVERIVFELLLCPSFILLHISPWPVSLSSPLLPLFLSLSPPSPHIFPFSLHSTSSPHSTNSLSDYADLSEPPHKKDWVFWRRPIGGEGAHQQRVHGQPPCQGRRQDAGQEDAAVVPIKPEKNRQEPAHGAGRLCVQEPRQIPQPVLSDLLLNNPPVTE